MKVYELMNKLSEMPAGAKVRINMIKTLDEMPEFDGEESRQIDFELMSVEKCNDDVILDGWAD